MTRFLLPLAVFLALAGFLAAGLKLNPREVPSPLIDKPAPSFRLPQLAEPDRSLAPEDMRGQVWILNVWASWCVSCRQEHSVLMDLARAGEVAVYGLAYKDEREAGTAWLREHGNPYLASVLDRDGRTGIELGVYGVPETFVIDRSGTVRRKFIGPLSESVVRTELLPLVRRLNAAS